MGNSNWETPDYFFKQCDAAWGPFQLDAAASALNTKTAQYIGPDNKFENRRDALRTSWVDLFPSNFTNPPNIWLNPPFENLWDWCAKAVHESQGGFRQKGLRVVMLLPNDTDTRWFHILNKRAEIYLTEGRIKFIDPEGNGRSSPRQGHLVAVLYPPIDGLIRPTGVVGTIRAGK